MDLHLFLVLESILSSVFLLAVVFGIAGQSETLSKQSEKMDHTLALLTDLIVRREEEA